ncbi:penicillin acylase family protein [Candidatus Binatia bacterium]|nr:penicillin acylase family protein [Candidatus Binatia bacterium]
MINRALFSLAALLLLAIPARAADIARYILPPGNYGGVPFTDNSRDQLPLYTGLTPLRDDVTLADIEQLYLPEDFQPIAPAREEITGRPGLNLIYDAYGVPHVYGETREDMAFGAGWATARDRSLLLQVGRNPARVAVADVPNIDAFSLVTSVQSFTPSPEAEALVTAQVELLKTEYGAEGRQVIADAQAYADGMNAYNAAHGVNDPPATVNDIIAVTAFIGSIFGAGGGGEAANSDLLAKLQDELGNRKGHDVWEDLMLADDPEAPTTIDRTFRYGPLTGGPVTGSVVLDARSIESIDPRQTPTEAAAAPARRRASNFLVTAPSRSASGNSLAVMGPQLGYYYPEIVQQIHLEGPGIKAQGVAVPGLAMYLLIGRTEDYAWSLTSAGHDVRDVYVEELCEPGRGKPTRASKHYVFKGKCTAMQTFNAGTLGDTPLIYDTTVHGGVFATATVDGKPYALSRRRSTFGRDALNLIALKRMTEGRASTPSRFWQTANQFGFTFNWAYVSRQATAYFSSGLLPRRPRGLDRRLPTLGNGRYEWLGYLQERQHPHDVSGPDGLLLNWNNRSAPGFMHGDDEPYGSVQRVENFDKWPAKPVITDNVGIMNRAATEDVRASVWPVISRTLRRADAPSARDQQVLDIMDDWIERDAPRIDVDGDGKFDDAGAVIMDAVFRPIVEAVLSPVLGDLVDDVNDVRGLNGLEGASYVDKDLRTLLGEPVTGRYHVRYCGGGSLSACTASLWQVVHATADQLAADQGKADPSQWRKDASTTGFVPNVLPDRFPTTNRPTFQQVLELDRNG